MELLNPLEQLLSVCAQDGEACWISGVRHDQARARRDLGVHEMTPQGVTRIHPMLHWTAEQISEYIDCYALPKHPLAEKGYDSIGCQPCTVPGSGREGRWPGQVKDGCGIHGLISRKVSTEPQA